MKKYLVGLTATVVCLGLIPAFAQLGVPNSGPEFDAGADELTKLFGDNSAFSATCKTQIKPSSGKTVIMPGKFAIDTGKMRFEMNLSEATGLPIPPSILAMGFDQLITISLPKDKLLYLIYPGLQSYLAQNTTTEAVAGTNQNFNLTTTELGKETVDGHPCVENKVVVTGNKVETQEFTVWNATDLKNLPIKIFLTKTNVEITMTFTDVSLAKPDASLFNPPASYTRYDNMQTMMQQVMMKKMGAMGLPPPTQ
jgi:hypothetical protein